MLINGEKYACEACVRGHRVSNCQHHDRPLQHINKKGRPVSQCPHCRGLRKSRAAHVKCECGDKGHNATQCRSDPKSDNKACCCSHTGKCNCSLKKDNHLELGPDGRPNALNRHSRSNSSKSRSESPLTVFTNGHHKPVHKSNHMAHMYSAPYHIPRPHSLHGRMETNRSVDSLPTMGMDDSLFSGLESPLPTQRDRLVRSEHGSPHPSSPGSIDMLPGTPPSLSLGYPDMTGSASPIANGHTARPPPPLQIDLSSITSAPHDTPKSSHSLYSTPEPDMGAFSAGLEPPSVDWSTFDLPIDQHQGVSSPFSQHGSYASVDLNHAGAQGMAPTSAAIPQPQSPSPGEFSDTDEFGGGAVLGTQSPVNPPSLVHTGVSDTSEGWETEMNPMNTASAISMLPGPAPPHSHHHPGQYQHQQQQQQQRHQLYHHQHTHSAGSVNLDDYIKEAVAVNASARYGMESPMPETPGHATTSASRHHSPYATAFASPVEAHHKFAPTSVPVSDLPYSPALSIAHTAGPPTSVGSPEPFWLSHLAGPPGAPGSGPGSEASRPGSAHSFDAFPSNLSVW